MSFNSSNIEQPPLSEIRVPISLRGHAIPLKRVSSAASDPEVMIPLQPGESIHVGYEPICGEEAFQILRKTKSPFQMVSIVGATGKHIIRIPRDDVRVERIVRLCHKFTCTNLNISVILPKREFLNDFPRKSIDECTFIYVSDEKLARIRILIQAHISDQDAEEYGIMVDRLSGSNSMHAQLFNHFKRYIESDGTLDPRVRPLKREVKEFASDEEHVHLFAKEKILRRYREVPETAVVSKPTVEDLQKTIEDYKKQIEELTRLCEEQRLQLESK